MLEILALLIPVLIEVEGMVEVAKGEVVRILLIAVVDVVWEDVAVAIGDETGLHQVEVKLLQDILVLKTGSH
jgi:hypothetical protein